MEDAAPSDKVSDVVRKIRALCGAAHAMCTRHSKEKC